MYGKHLCSRVVGIRLSFPLFVVSVADMVICPKYKRRKYYLEGSMRRNNKEDYILSAQMVALNVHRLSFK